MAFPAQPSSAPNDQPRNVDQIVLVHHAVSEPREQRSRQERAACGAGQIAIGADAPEGAGQHFKFFWSVASIFECTLAHDATTHR